MLGVITNESNLLKMVLNEKIIPEGVSPTTIIKILIKYFYLKCKNKNNTNDYIYENVLKVLEKIYGDDYLYTKWNKRVNKEIKSFNRNKAIYKTEIKMNDIKGIRITKNELDKIKQLNNIRLEKVAFIFLVYAKISYTQKELNTKEYWTNMCYGNVFKEAKVNNKSKNKIEILHKLYEKKYIMNSVRGDKIATKILFVDKEQNESDKDFIINDFNNVVYQYLIWRGQKWRKCEVCGKWIKQKSKKPPKYCTKCKKEKQKEWDKKYHKNH